MRKCELLLIEAVAKLPALGKSMILRFFCESGIATRRQRAAACPEGQARRSRRKRPQKGDFPRAGSFAIGSLIYLGFVHPLHGEPIKTPQHVFACFLHRIFNHPGDYPLPTDMTFKKYANHTIDQTTEYFDPDLVKLGDTIYLADWYITWFVREIHQKIKHPYILISNDSDGSHPDPGTWDYDERWGAPPAVDAVRTFLYDPKVAAWFCKNMLLSRHPKIVQIPIGQNIIYWGHCPDAIFPLLNREDFDKKYLLYMNMQLGTHSSRPHVAALFQNQPYCFSRINNLQHQGIPRPQFYEELSQGIFTVTPPGYGPDTVRFWEAIVLGCIPIVKHYELDDLYADLPVLFIDEWEEVNEEFLKQKQLEIKAKKIGKEKAYFDYWAQKIDAYQNRVREGLNAFSSLKATRFKDETLNDLSTLLNSKALRRDRLLCKGAAMGLRPFEIAHKCHFLTKIYVSDPWGAREFESPAAHLEPFTQSFLIDHDTKMEAINFYADPYFPLSNLANAKVHVFLDLTYLRHQLEADLERVYLQMVPGALLCGNSLEDLYVRRVLKKFSEKYSQQMDHLGDIWFFER